MSLDPTHTEVQFFLARLFAMAPDAAGAGARVAKPLPSALDARHVVAPPAPTPSMRLARLSTEQVRAFEMSGEQPITLDAPKRHLDDPITEERERPTSIFAAAATTPTSLEDTFRHRAARLRGRGAR